MSFPELSVVSSVASSLLGPLVLLGVSLVLLRVALIIYRIWFHPLSVFPGPKLLAATSLPSQWQNNITGTWFKRVPELQRKYGPVVRIGPNHLALDGSVGWPQVYGRRPGSGGAEFTKYPDFFFPGDHISIIGANSTENHRRQRRQLGHAFSEAALVEQEGIINKYISLLLDRLEEKSEAGTQPLNMVNWFNFTTFDIIGDLTFADAFHCLEGSDYHPWVSSFFQGIKGGALRRFITRYPFLRPLMLYALGPKMIKISEQNQKFSQMKAKSRMALGAEPKDGRKDFMTYMLRRDRDGKEGMSEMEIVYNSPILIGAGSETTATALSGLFFYMLQNPASYNFLVDEVRGAFHKEDDITIKSTARLEYLHACLEECLRIYPPAVETPPRVCPGAEIEGKYVPPGTVISIYQWATNHNPASFADADEWHPERWLPASHPQYNAKYQNDNRAVFKPFSFGARDCLGKNLAYSEMRVVVARILHRFDVEMAPGQLDWHAVQHVFMVWDKGPLYFYLKPRKAVV